MKKLDFVKIFGYFNYKRDEGRRLKVLRDWKVLFFFFVFVFFFFVILDVCFLWALERGLFKEEELTKTPGKAGQIVLHEDVLDKIIENLDKKEERFNSILSQPPLEDPSR